MDDNWGSTIVGKLHFKMDDDHHWGSPNDFAKTSIWWKTIFDASWNDGWLEESEAWNIWGFPEIGAPPVIIHF